MSFTFSQKNQNLYRKKFIIVGISDMSFNVNPFQYMNSWLIEAKNIHDAIRVCILNDNTSVIKEIISDILNFSHQYITDEDVLANVNNMRSMFNEKDIDIKQLSSDLFYDFVSVYIEVLVEIFVYFWNQQLYINIWEA